MISRPFMYLLFGVAEKLRVTGFQICNPQPLCRLWWLFNEIQVKGKLIREKGWSSLHLWTPPAVVFLCCSLLSDSSHSLVCVFLLNECLTMKSLFVVRSLLRDQREVPVFYCADYEVLSLVDWLSAVLIITFIPIVVIFMPILIVVTGIDGSAAVYC